jgi:hypothetical protein
MQNGQVFELLMPTRHIKDSESSSLPTPRASEPGSTSAGYGDSLNDFASRITVGYARKDLQTLPTPKARDHQAEGYEAGLRRSSPQVGTIVKGLVEGDKRVLLRSPKASEGQGGALGEAEARKRGNTVGVRDQVMDLVAAQGAKVSRAIMNGGEVKLLPTLRASDGYERRNQKTMDRIAKEGGDMTMPTLARTTTDWGKFEPAVRLWEQEIKRQAPSPTKPDGKEGAHRLSSKFTEWMMGLPEGWITDVGLKRNEELKLAGNGVVPQQAELALRLLLNSDEE